MLLKPWYNLIIRTIVLLKRKANYEIMIKSINLPNVKNISSNKRQLINHTNQHNSDTPSLPSIITNSTNKVMSNNNNNNNNNDISLSNDQRSIIFKAIEHLPDNKQEILLSTMNQLINSLDKEINSTVTDSNNKLPNISNSQSKITFESLIKPKISDNIKNLHRILYNIKLAMQKNPQSLYQYDLTGRGKEALISGTMLKEKLINEFNILLSNSEIEILMNKYDVNNLGVINIVDVLGSARNIKLKDNKIYKKIKIIKKVISKKSNHIPTNISNNPVVNDQEVMQMLAMKLGLYSKQILLTNHIKQFTNNISMYITIKEFKDLLFKLSFNLTNREMKLLVKRYSNESNSNLINYKQFCKEFIQLGRFTNQVLYNRHIMNVYVSTMKGNDSNNNIDSNINLITSNMNTNDNDIYNNFIIQTYEELENNYNDYSILNNNNNNNR